jgi:hypothetical protein
MIQTKAAEDKNTRTRVVFSTGVSFAAAMQEIVKWERIFLYLVIRAP